MKEVQPNGVVFCVAFCGAGCLACLSDGPIIIADMASGGTVLTQASAV